MHRSHRALVVDDNEDIRDLLVLVLEQSGIEVRSAANGTQALETVRSFDPDLVTLDLSLPDIDGTDVCREIRTFSDAYVVMITARSDEIDRLVGLELGADDYLTKPFSPRELVARVKAMLRRVELDKATPCSASSSCERVKIRPGRAASVASSWNSVGVRSTALPATTVRILGTSRVTSRTRMVSVAAAGGSARRRTARTRATSSRGLNGLVR